MFLGAALGARPLTWVDSGVATGCFVPCHVAQVGAWASCKRGPAGPSVTIAFWLWTAFSRWRHGWSGLGLWPPDPLRFLLIHVSFFFPQQNV